MKPDGVVTMEFPHLQRLMEQNQFDTIYHEHFSYFSFLTVERVFAAHGLTLFDVDELSTHGGSLRIYGRHAEDASKPRARRVEELLAREHSLGFDKIETYRKFDEQVKATKRDILDCLIALKRANKQIVGYGAPGKGNTLLNYCGIRTDFLDYTVDRNPYKQGKYHAGHSYTDPFAGYDPQNPAGLHIHLAVESARGNHDANGLRPRLGLSVHRSDPQARDHRVTFDQQSGGGDVR